MVDLLLIEDDPRDAELMVRALKKYDIPNNLVHLEDGQAALDFIFNNDPGAHAQVADLKVIILDLKLPRVNGIEVLKRIKSDPRTSLIPVVIMSSSQQSVDVTDCYRCGVNSYIVKPLGFDGFMKVVGELGRYWLHTNQPHC